MGANTLIPCFTKLSPILHPKGNLFKIIQKSSEQYEGFGEAYFTSINKGATKGWKRHKEMHLNLTVPIGMVKFHVFNESTGRGVEYAVGDKNHGRLYIPPGYWVAFTGVGDALNLILNIASIEHDPSESENKDLEAFPLNL